MAPLTIEKKLLDIITEKKLKTIFLNGSHLKRCISFYNFLKSESVDIIFSYLLTTNFYGGLIGKVAGVKYTVGGIRNSAFSKKKLFLQKCLNNYINNFTIYNNRRGLEELTVEGFRKQKALIIPNCIELSNKSIVRKKSNSVKILSVGRFIQQKDYYTAIKAISCLREKFIEFQYTIIGYGILKNQIQNWINKLNLANFIKVIINPSNLNEYYAEADIYLMTSLFEGLSNTVLEAMNFSLPLVITDVGDNDRLVKNGENGFICKPKDSNKIAISLLELCTSYEKRINFGKRSYEILKENYSYEIFQKRYINFIEGLEV